MQPTWQQSTGIFSQIWLQVKYLDKKKSKPPFYFFGAKLYSKHGQKSGNFEKIDRIMAIENVMKRLILSLFDFYYIVLAMYVGNMAVIHRSIQPNLAKS